MSDKKTTLQIETTIENFYKQLPPLPANAVEAIFKITPWLAIIFGIIGALVAISAFGILSFLTPYAALSGAVSPIGLGIVSTLGLLVSSVIMLLAYPGLKAGKLSGWTMLFWAEVVSALTSVIGINIGSVIGALIGFYIIFQIKPKYK